MTYPRQIQGGGYEWVPEWIKTPASWLQSGWQSGFREPKAPWAPKGDKAPWGSKGGIDWSAWLGQLISYDPQYENFISYIAPGGTTEEKYWSELAYFLEQEIAAGRLTRVQADDMEAIAEQMLEDANVAPDFRQILTRYRQQQGEYEQWEAQEPMTQRRLAWEQQVRGGQWEAQQQAEKRARTAQEEAERYRQAGARAPIMPTPQEIPAGATGWIKRWFADQATKWGEPEPGPRIAKSLTWSKEKGYEIYQPEPWEKPETGTVVPGELIGKPSLGPGEYWERAGGGWQPTGGSQYFKPKAPEAPEWLARFIPEQFEPERMAARGARVSPGTQLLGYNPALEMEKIAPSSVLSAQQVAQVPPSEWGGFAGYLEWATGKPWSEALQEYQWQIERMLPSRQARRGMWTPVRSSR